MGGRGARRSRGRTSSTVKIRWRISAHVRTAILGALAVLGVAREARAQEYFGQNQVEYRHFHWRVLQTEHFTVHYYPEEREAAFDLARMAERS